MYSGEMYGPKETRLLELLGVRCAGMLLRADKTAEPAAVRRGVKASKAPFKENIIEIKISGFVLMLFCYLT